MKYLYSLLIAVVLFSCTKTQYDEYETVAGQATFTNYIAVGNSLTQGYQDGGMHNEFGQQDNSYPAIIARQMQLANPSMIFKQPTVPPLGQGYMHLEYINGEIEVIKAYDEDVINNPTAIDDDPAWANWGDQTMKYNNLGLSGIKLVNCLSGGKNTTINFNLLQLSLNENGRFLDFGDEINPITYLDHIKQSKATFFTNWLGNNDVLGWSTEGGDDGPVTNEIGITVPGLFLTQLSDLDEFRNKYDSVLAAFKSMGAKGVCATLPDVTSIPYFNTVTLEAVDDDVWIREGADTTIVRLATEDDLLLLTASDELADGLGKAQSKPLKHTVVLDKDEIAIVQNRTNEINNAIRSLANSYGFALADMNAFMKTLTNTGLSFDGVDFTPKYIEGGVFSLDGVHPNGRGYAIIANEFIRVINDFYGSNLQTVAVNNYRGITFP
jgi:lysophospholipase L1-like esterase